jgi:hypothetical protein
LIKIEIVAEDLNPANGLILKSQCAEILREWSVITCVNDEVVLKSCLLSSPDVRFATEVMVQKGCRSAAEAYNTAMAKAKTDLLIFVHQDVYLPEGWIRAVQNAIETLSKTDPNWGVLGVWGGIRSGNPGYMYWTGVKGTAGKPFQGFLEVNTLDEVVLIIRKSSGLHFDEQLAGYHFYGTDVCLEARRRGMKCYSINAFCIHNTNGYKLLPLAFWRGFLFIRRKWKAELPITSPCVEVTFWCWPAIRWNICQVVNLMLGRHSAAKRVEDPGQLYKEMVRSGLIALPEIAGSDKQVSQ